MQIIVSGHTAQRQNILVYLVPTFSWPLPPPWSHMPKAGDRLKALKCLLKSGDTKSIVYYAGVSRSRDIYILAANYLQNLDWHDDPQVGTRRRYLTTWNVSHVR